MALHDSAFAGCPADRPRMRSRSQRPARAATERDARRPPGRSRTPSAASRRASSFCDRRVEHAARHGAGRRRRRTGRRPARGATSRRERALVARRGRTGGLATMTSNGPSTPSRYDVRDELGCGRRRRGDRRSVRATASAPAETSVATTERADGLAGERHREAAAAGADVGDIAGALARRAAARSASSTMNSVSGRGIRTAGETREVETPELADADDVGGRLARARGGRSSSENRGSSAVGRRSRCSSVSSRARSHPSSVRA